jgi:hypothetical protein
MMSALYGCAQVLKWCLFCVTSVRRTLVTAGSGADVHSVTAWAALIGLLSLRQIGVEPRVTPTPPDAVSHTQLAELWQDPTDIELRDLFAGPQLGTAAPAQDESFTFISQKVTGFSPGYDVKDAAGNEWSVKLGPEAQTEVVASRLLWAIGYHQPAVYYVDRWTLSGGPSPGVQMGARFRPKDSVLKTDGTWLWQRNPFVDLQPYRGLVVMMLLLNSTDLRNENNVIYKVRGSDAEPNRWYVVKDLGATFGETGVYRPRRNDIELFERDPFLNVDAHGRSRFAYRGLQKELLRQLSAADVKWTCDLLGRLSDAQWRDAFRAGGYSNDVAARYIAAVQERIRLGRTLDGTFTGEDSDFWVSRQVHRAAAALRSVPKHLH